MNTMSKVISIALKDMKLRFSSKVELLFFLILPLVFTLILSGVLSSDGASKIVMIVVDEDNSELSRKMVNLLQSSVTVAPSLRERENAQETFDKREAAAILIISSGMESSLKAGQPVALDFTLDTSNNNGLAAQQEVQKAIDQISHSLVVASVSTARGRANPTIHGSYPAPGILRPEPDRCPAGVRQCPDPHCHHPAREHRRYRNPARNPGSPSLCRSAHYLGLYTAPGYQPANG